MERLGFDEVFMDITDIVDYNQNLLNPNDLAHSFFSLERNDPTVGFTFDATIFAGHTYPPQQMPSAISNSQGNDWLTTRLILGSHFAQHLRLGLDEEKGYTSSVGISTNKLLSKLVGNLNKPKAQTTLLPPYDMLEDGISYNAENTQESNVTMFIDGHDIGKIPGIGFKMAQRIRNHVLSRPPESGTGSGWGGTKESVTVRDVRLFPGMGPEMLERILGGPGVERGIGSKAWGLINGIDDTEIQKAKKVPSQISIEDTYGRLDTMPQVLKELRRLATSLIKRMHTDLLEDDDDPESGSGSKKRWSANPKTVRLSTRPRPPPNADGTRTRSFNRISRSGPLPSFVFNLNNGIDSIVERLVQECLVPMFKRLHPPHAVWNLSLINIGVTNMVETAREDGGGAGGRDISKMFKRQESTLREWRVADRDVPPDPVHGNDNNHHHNHQQAEPSAGDGAPNDDNDHDDNDDILASSEDAIYETQQNSIDDAWQEEEDDDDERPSCEICRRCGAMMPAFAIPAHERFHSLEQEEE